MHFTVFVFMFMHSVLFLHLSLLYSTHAPNQIPKHVYHILASKVILILINKRKQSKATLDKLYVLCLLDAGSSLWRK